MTTHPLDDAARFDQERNCIPPAPVARVDKPHFDATCRELFLERCRQERKHGATNLRKRAELSPLHAFLHWQQILGEELGEVSRAYLEKDYQNMRKEMLEAAAVLIAMVEYGDTDGWFPPKTTEVLEHITFKDGVRTVDARVYLGPERRAPNNAFTRACWNGGPNMRADRRGLQTALGRRKGQRRSGNRELAVVGNGVGTPGLTAIVVRETDAQHRVGPIVYQGPNRRNANGGRRTPGYNRRQS